MRYASENTRQGAATPNSGTVSMKPVIAEGRQGEPGLPGVNAVPTVEAVADYVEDPSGNALTVALTNTQVPAKGSTDRGGLVTRYYQKLATLDGQSGVMGATLSGIYSASGNIGDALHSDILIQARQRGASTFTVQASAQGTIAVTPGVELYYKPISTYVFEIWARRPAYDGQPRLNVLGFDGNVTVEMATEQTSTPSGLVAVPISSLASSYAQASRFPSADGLYAFFPCTPDTYRDGKLYWTEGSYGVGGFDLHPDSRTPQWTSGNGPFGAPGLLLDAEDPTCFVFGGIEDGTGAGPFDMGPWQKFTVLIAWKPTDGNRETHQCPVAAHPESGPKQGRQWAIYYNQNTNDAPRALDPHISDRGGATPADPEDYNKEFPATARAFIDRPSIVGASYDTEYVTAYIDGVSDYWVNPNSLPAAPFPRRGNPMRLPWGLLNDPTAVKGSIGSSLGGEGDYDIVNPASGELYGIWIYNRVLTPEEIFRHQIELSRRMEIPGVTLDWMTDNQYLEGVNAGTSLVADVGVERRGGKQMSQLPPRLSSTTTNPDWKVSRGSSTGESYARAAHLLRVADANPGVWWFPIPEGAVNTKHLTRATWRVNSPSSAPNHRLLIGVRRPAGDTWYVSNDTYSPKASATDAVYDWSAALDKEYVFRAIAGSGGDGVVGFDSGKWKQLTTFDPSGGYLMNYITNPAAEVSTSWSAVSGGSGVMTIGGTAVSPHGGTNARRITVGTAPANLSEMSSNGGSVSIDTTFIAQQTYHGDIYVRPSIAQKLFAQIVWQQSGGSTISSTNGTVTDCPANVWTRLSASAQGPALGVKALLRVLGSSTGTLWTAGDTLDLDSATFVDGAVAPTWTNSMIWIGSTNGSVSLIPNAGSVYGRPIVVSGSTNTDTLESGDLIGIGFYCPGQASGVHRIDDLKLWVS